MRILKNEAATSVAFGVLLMVGIVVTVSGLTTLFLSEFSKMNVKGPTAGILVMEFHETPGINDIKIIHVGGDSLKPGEWKLSIVKAGNRPVFQFGSTDFSVGNQILTTNLTDGNGTYIVTNSNVYTNGTAGTLEAGNRYNVEILIYPFKTIAVDTDVTLN